jgi:hypothetical protein
MRATSLTQNFEITGSEIHGTLGGKSFNCFLHPLSAQLPPGTYKISGRMENSAYGVFALISPAGGLNQEKWIGPITGKFAYGKGLGPLVNEKWIGSFGHEKWIGATADKSSLLTDKQFTPSTASEGPFLLTSKLHAGKGCLVVTSGFADLMDALQAAGGLSIAVY